MVSYFRPWDFKRSVSSILTNTTNFRLTIIDNSHGGLESELDRFATHPNVTVYRNQTNLGFGAGFMRWYYQIMDDRHHDSFISIDADIQVPPNWLIDLTKAANYIRSHQQLGIIAPAIKNNPEDSFSQQLQRNRLTMHVKSPSFNNIIGNIYYNRQIAGCLYFIDRTFFENVGGYTIDYLYGAEDGKLTLAAEQQRRFVGITSDVEVLHLNNDSIDEYIKWKQINANKLGINKGFWD